MSILLCTLQPLTRLVLDAQAPLSREGIQESLGKVKGDESIEKNHTCDYGG